MGASSAATSGPSGEELPWSRIAVKTSSQAASATHDHHSGIANEFVRRGGRSGWNDPCSAVDAKIHVVDPGLEMKAQRPAILAAACESLGRPLRRVARDLDELSAARPHLDRVPAFAIGCDVPLRTVGAARSAMPAPCRVQAQAERGLPRVILRSAEEIGCVASRRADE